MPQNIEQADIDKILKKPSSNKVEAKRFLAKYSKPYFIDGMTLPANFELKINKKKTAICLIDKLILIIRVSRMPWILKSPTKKLIIKVVLR